MRKFGFSIEEKSQIDNLKIATVNIGKAMDRKTTKYTKPVLKIGV
nr:hypothetical protein [Dendronalium sp. ChiSLP03b]MDZ8204573.1 hypothetical protein [Dendronalium sp. ChiSLP03b]